MSLRQNHKKVLHVVTEMTWRGGENQVNILMEGLSSRNTISFLAAPRSSAILNRVCDRVGKLPLEMRGLALVAAAWKIRQFCQENTIDIFDAHTSHAHNIGLVVKKLMPSIILVVHRRVDYEVGKHFFGKLKYHSPLVQHYIAISQCIRGILIGGGIAREKITTISSAVPQPPTVSTNAIAKLHKDLQISPTNKLIVSVGYLTSQKGHEVLISALPEVINQFPNLICLIAGDGPLRPSLEKMRIEMGLENHLKFLGIRNDVPVLLRAAQIFAMPSHSEGLGTSVLDALFSECCIVATDVGGIPEMIIHKKTGLLSPKGESKLFAKNLIWALKNPNLSQKLAEAGRKYVLEKFSVDHLVETTDKLYSKLLRDQETQ